MLLHSHRCALALMAVAALFTLDRIARGDDTTSGLTNGMSRLAGAVGEYFEKEGHEKVVKLGTVISADGEGSELLRRMLQDHLTKQKFDIKPKAKFAISGRFLKNVPKDGESKEAALKVKAEIRDATSDDVVQPISIPIFGDEAVGVLGPTAELPTNGPKGTEPERQRELNDRLDHPKVFVVGQEVRASAESPFGIEILARHGTSSSTSIRAPKVNDGQAFVDLNRGEEYVVRLHNRAPFEAAVTLTIDGLSMFAFSEDGNFGSQVLVAPGKTADIPGWYITKQRSDAFEITSYSKSAAASKGVTGTVGVITAAFHAAWDPKSTPPSDETGAKGADTATGKGRPIEQRYEAVQRITGKLRSFVSVRYNR